MRKIMILHFAFFSSFLNAQTIIQRDALIEQMVKQVSADSLQSYINTMVGFGTRHTLSTQNSSTKGIGAARQWILQKFVEFGKSTSNRFTSFIDTVTLEAGKRRIDQPTLLGNVIGVLKGSDDTDNRIFMISAHVDSRNKNEMDREKDAPGANDDGSGVAAVLECARILCKQSFPATIVFVAFSGEEQGLYGGALMADNAIKNKWNIEALLNNDIMGSNNSSETNIINNTQVRVFSEGLPAFETEKNASNIRQLGLENDGKARQLARYIKEIGERYVEHLDIVLVYRNDRFLRGGDHTPFVQKGITAVRISEMNENYYHQHEDVQIRNGIQYGDLAQFMDFEYLRKNTGMNLSVLANLAKSPGSPKEVLMDVKKLSNQTQLSWQKPDFGKVKGYYVLIRETTASIWQKKIFTKDLSIQLPYSKDNYLFAVQSVSEDGNESLVVTPSVSR